MWYTLHERKNWKQIMEGQRPGMPTNMISLGAGSDALFQPHLTSIHRVMFNEKISSEHQIKNPSSSSIKDTQASSGEGQEISGQQ